jgi:hypothetical protein
LTDVKIITIIQEEITDSKIPRHKEEVHFKGEVTLTYVKKFQVMILVKINEKL